MSRRSSGQSTIGGKQTVAGKPRRIQAVGVRCLRSTTAFVKWVVPIITPSMVAVSMPESAMTLRRAVAIPSDTFAVVGVLVELTTVVPSINTASVFVPPTSIPILIFFSLAYDWLFSCGRPARSSLRR